MPRTSIIRRDGKSWIIEIEYEDPVPLFANLISLVPKFETSSRVGHGGARMAGRRRHRLPSATRSPGDEQCRLAGSLAARETRVRAA